jgi:N-acetylglutamate synthase-like GNAT family acetyltransferase
MLFVYRTATEEDIPAIKELSDVMLTPSGLGVATIPKITALVKSPSTLFALAEHAGDLVGFTCAIVHESVFNDRRRVSDIGIFVLPAYRGTEVAAVLVETLEHWAMQQAAEEVWLGQTTGSNIDKVAEYYQRLGYTIRGFNAVKEL